MKLGRCTGGIMLAGSLLVGAVVACSGGTSGGNGSGFPYSGPSCSGGVMSSACWSCTENNCAPGCITSDCGDYFSCFCACASGDSTCYSGCSQKLSPACATCEKNVYSCLGQSCQSACSGGSSSGGGSGSGSSSGGVGTTSLYCDVTTSGIHECEGYQNLTAAQASAATQSCTGTIMGKIVSGCSTSGQVGCCTLTQSGISAEICYYCGDPSTTASTCTSQSGGTWTAGPGGPTNCD